LTHTGSEAGECMSMNVRLLAVLFGALLATSGSGCALVDRLNKIQDLEEAQAIQSLEKQPGRSRSDFTLSPLHANPSTVAFGTIVIASENRQTVVISNPSDFIVTVLRVSVHGSGFAIVRRLGGPSVIPAHGKLAFTLAFHPMVQGESSGDLILEIDSAGGRFTRVTLKGRGVS
jgi:hypothetical protein